MQHHLFIAGTGRAGTSFLVQYLHACGLETQLSLLPEAKLDEIANAGLEDYPVEGARLPYVLKSPWLHQFIDGLLERDDISLDAVILPMRDLAEAASSRVILEMRARYGAPNLNDDMRQWESWGLTPGGVVFSLNPIDQARLLAVGFHDTVFALVRKQIPLVFLDFTRMVADAEYMWTMLEPVLKSKTDRERALAAHAQTADTSKVRVARDSIGKSESPRQPEKGAPPVMHSKLPAMEQLDRDALLRELKLVRTARDAALTELEQTKIASAIRQHDSDEQLGALTHARDEATHALAALQSEFNTLGAQHAAETQRAYQLQRELDALRAQNESEALQHRDQVRKLEATIGEFKSSRSWQITRPLRGLSTLLSRQAKA